MFWKFLKFLIALVLLPLLAGQIWTLIDLLYWLVPAGDWREMWALSLVAGFIVWLLIFFWLPRPMWLYVLGHEFTHALAAMLAGGKVTAFKVSSKGGHIMTDRVNWWIALSPYFVPIYTLVWIGLWVTVDFYYPLKEWVPLLFFVIGLSWCFHFTFTVSMFHLRQTDLTSQGIVFSAVIILIFNLAVVVPPIALLTHNLKKSGQDFLQRTGQCYLMTGKGFADAGSWAVNTWRQEAK